MADKFRSLFPVDARFVEGEQPTHQKFTGIVSLVKGALFEIEKALGAIRVPLSASTTGNAPYPAGPSVDRDSYDTNYINFNTGITSIARSIGPMSALNPRYLGGTNWPKTAFSVGVKLKTNTTVQQLPFLPLDVTTILPADFTGTEAPDIFGVRVTSPDSAQFGNTYYVSDDGQLHTGKPVVGDVFLKYAISVVNGDAGKGAGYNVIPDPSILNFDMSERQNKTTLNTDYGACRLEITAINSSEIVCNLRLPEVISVPFSKISRTLEVEDFDPVGVLDEGSPNLRRYKLPDVYKSGALELNSIYLFNELNGTVLEEARFERVNDFNLTVYLPNHYRTSLIDDVNTAFDTVGKVNTKHFFLICNGNSIASQLGKLKLDMESHEHDGVNSVRVSHNDLADVNNTIPVLPAQLNVYSIGNTTPTEQGVALSGLSSTSTRWFNRKFGKGFFNENPHPYYFHRLGYMGGGTDGYYAERNFPGNAASNLNNAFAGDFVFLPVAVDGKFVFGRNESYSWSNSMTLNPTDNNVASHSMWFGLPPLTNKTSNSPSLIRAGRIRNGSVRMYFDPWIQTSASRYENDENTDNQIEAIAEPLSKYGLGVGESGTYTDSLFYGFKQEKVVKGLNIQRGNLFFGFNEHKFLSSDEIAKGKSSANFLASEFNVVVTANKKAGNSATDAYKRKTGHREGFVVKAIEGSSILLSVGNLGEELIGNAVDTSAKTIDGTSGSVGLEASFGDGLLTTASSEQSNTLGSVIIASPGLATNKLFPWQVRGSSYATDAWYGGWKLGQEVGEKYTADGASRQNLGGFTWIAALTDPTYLAFLTDLNGVGDKTESPKNENSFPFGKVLIEGSTGIDFVIHKLNRLEKNSLKLPDFAEAKFWGTDDILKTENRTNIAAGANINLLYGYGKSYNKFNTVSSWTGSAANVRGIKGINTQSGLAGISPWTGSRHLQQIQYSDGPEEIEKTASSIRQASYIEAFEGFRCDPNQPYTVTYRLPFKVIQRVELERSSFTDWQTEVVDVVGLEFNTEYTAWYFKPEVILSTLPVKGMTPLLFPLKNEFTGTEIGSSETDRYYIKKNNKEFITSTYFEQPVLGNDGRFVLSENSILDIPIDNNGYGIFVDQIIRYYDFLLWSYENEDPGSTFDRVRRFIPGKSIVDFKVDLNYSQLVFGDESNSNDFGKVPYSLIETRNSLSEIDIDYFKATGENDLISYLPVNELVGRFAQPTTEEYVFKSHGNFGKYARNSGGGGAVLNEGAIDSVDSQVEPYKASLILLKTNLNSLGEDNASYEMTPDSFQEYCNRIRDQVRPNVESENITAAYGLPVEPSDTSWAVKIECPPKLPSEIYARNTLYKNAPYSLFKATIDGNEIGQYKTGPGSELYMSFQGWITLTLVSRTPTRTISPDRV
jgi:hypothetical protein